MMIPRYIIYLGKFVCVICWWPYPTGMPNTDAFVIILLRLLDLREQASPGHPPAQSCPPPERLLSR